MLLTVTTTHAPATDLGYLLHKSPFRVHAFDLTFGKAHVFYPDASDSLCTAALMVEVDPIQLVRGHRTRTDDGPLGQYVNDRPYAASSFLSVAIGEVYGTALGGRSKDRPELAQSRIPLSAGLSVVSCRGGEPLLRRLFEPLGYTLEATEHLLDETHPDWGVSRYITVRLTGERRVCELLTHLYVLLPVLDDDKHYWVGDDEVDKLVRRGEGWLPAHPERELLARIRSAADRVGLWEELGTDWLCLDCELMPWSAKAQELLQSQYAAVGAAARAALADSVVALERANTRGADVEALLTRTRERASLAARYVAAYRRYGWPVASIDDLRVAPFHLLASEGKVHTDRTHLWHMDTLARLASAGSPLLVATPYRAVDVTDPGSEEEGVRWWDELTARGGEGMVVKPLDFLARGRRGLVQPAVKCRGAEYLRIIYGLEHTLPENLERLRARGLSVKRSLASRELALGIEGLERFVRKEPLRRVHECVFAVLALESEPVDPRL